MAAVFSLYARESHYAMVYRWPALPQKFSRSPMIMWCKSGILHEKRIPFLLRGKNYMIGKLPDDSFCLLC